MRTQSALTVRPHVAMLSLLAALAAITQVFAQDVTLQYRWSKGEEFTYRLVQQITTTVSGTPGGAGEMNVEIRISQVLRTSVEDVAADGTATLKYVYESAKWEMTSPMGSSAYDTAAPDPSGAPAGPMTVLAALIGEPFTVVMSRSGGVEKVEGMDRLMEKVFGSMPQNPAALAVVDSFRKGMGDDGMRNMFAQSYSPFPDRPVKPGDTWQTQATAMNPMTGSMTTTNTFTLRAIEVSGSNRVARIATSMAFKMDQKTSGAMASALGLTLQVGDSTGEGELLFDVDGGRLQRSTMRMDMSMAMSRSGPDGAPMNMRNVVKTVTTIELLPPMMAR